MKSHIDDSRIKDGFILWSWGSASINPSSTIEDISRQFPDLSFQVEIISEGLGIRGEQKFVSGVLHQSDIVAWNKPLEGKVEKYEMSLFNTYFIELLSNCESFLSNLPKGELERVS